jgi:Kdo2-lipid IVA lauroyltransferase/acyltransferase
MAEADAERQAARLAVSFGLRWRYALSGLVFALAYRLLRLRRPVIEQNLARSFPQLDAAARRLIRNEFIARQAQVLAEIDYARTIDADEMRRRVALVDRSGLLAGGGRFVLVTGHSCNFEWMLLRLSLELGPAMMGIYKPLRGWGERYFLKVRGRFGAQLLPSKAIREEMARVREVRVLGLVADQVPRTSPDRLWTRFLNQDTAFFKGPERMARVLRAPIVYGSMRRLGPGQYEVELEPLTAVGERLPGGAATERYARRLERDIILDPASWWWSHRRWKLPPPMAGDTAATPAHEAESDQGSAAQVRK